MNVNRHLINVHVFYNTVECCVQIVEEIHHFIWRALGGHRSETANVAEVDGDPFE